ncbi:MAG: hypothetical protein ACK55Z_35780, partial [bacterium]
MSPLPFTTAIDLRQNRKYIPYALVPVLVLLILLLAAPQLITAPTKRLIQFNKPFSRPAPFQFVVKTTPLQVIQFEDFPLEVKLEGREIPAEVFVEIGENNYRLEKEDLSTF